MHLSLLSDSYLSDRLADAGLYADDEGPTAGEAHRDGVLRGLALIGLVAVLIGLGCLSSVMPCANAAPHKAHRNEHAVMKLNPPFAITRPMTRA